MATDTGKIVVGALAAVGVASLAAMAAKTALEAIKNNISFQVGMPSIDMSIQAINPIPGETYVRLDLPVELTNNNIFPIGAQYFFGVVKYGNLTLTEVNLPYGLWVPSGQTVTITIDVDIPVKRVLDDLYGIAQNGNIFNALINKIKLSGVFNLYGNLTQIPIEIKDLEIPIF